MSNYTTGKHRTPEDSAQYTTENENELSVHISVANLSPRTVTYVLSQSTSQSQTCRHVRRLSVYISVANLSPRTSSQSTSQSQTCRNVRRLSVHISVTNLSPRTSSLSTTITNFHLIKKPVVRHTKLTNSNTCH